MNTGLSLDACRGADNGAQFAYKEIIELPGAARGTIIFPGGVPR